MAHRQRPNFGSTMTTSTRPTSKRQSPPDQVVTTSGEIFFDGTVIDLMASADGGRPDLLLWDGKRATVAPRVTRSGVVYEGPVMDPTVGRIIQFPSSVERGPAVKLFADVAGLFEEYLGVRQAIAQRLSLWNASTWLSDVLPSPPPLMISGPDMAVGMIGFQLLSCVSRRALRLAGINRSALVVLPMHLRPTLLINQPDLPRRVWQLCLSSNHRGLHVPGKAGAVLDWVCSKAVFLGMAPSADAWCGEALSVTLPAAERGLPILDEQAMMRIAHEFQARFQGFRLDRLSGTRKGCFSTGKLLFAGSEVAQNLFACVQREPELIQAVTPLLSSQEQETTARRMLDPNIVIVEVLWKPAHQERKLTVKKITEASNVLLRLRGEKYEYNEEEIGWKLEHLGFKRHRNGSGMVLNFSSENSHLLHQLARTSGINFPKWPGCSDCTEPEVIGAQPILHEM
jgi:hypothetical protein